MSASKEFKEAHDDSIAKLPLRTQKLLSFVKDGDIDALKEAKFQLTDLNECYDKNDYSLANWAHLTEQQRVLDYFYSEAGKAYSATLSPETINLKSGFHGTPLLYWAAFCHQQEAAKLLLSNAGLKINTASSSGWTPLHISAWLGDLEMTKILIAHKASLNAVNATNTTPLYLAVEKGGADVATYLIQLGANIDGTTCAGNTLLHDSVLSGHLPVMRLLVEHGLNMDMTNTEGETPLLFAAQTGFLAAVDYLLQQGANMNKAAKDGSTPLIDATWNNHTKVVELLLSAGANPMLRYKDKKAYALAKTPEIKRLLLSAELTELLKSNAERKADSSFFDSKLSKSEMQIAISDLKLALEKGVSITELMQLKTKHAVLRLAPLHAYYEKVQSIAPTGVARELPRQLLSS